MKILIVATDHDLPEAQMICALHQKGIALEVMLEPSSKFIELFKRNDIVVHPFSFRGKFDLSGIARIRALLNTQHFDIVHCFSKKALSNVILASLFKSNKIIGYRGIVGNLSRFDPLAWLTFLNPKVSKVVCVCKAVETYLRTLPFKKDVPLTIYKGHRVEWYQELPAGDLREFGIPDDAITICCTANMRPRKGVQVLIDALKHIPERHNVHLLLVGDTGKCKPAEADYDSSRVHFAGYRKDAISLMRSADMFVLPSLRREGLPKVVIEAMSVGTIPVVTSSGGSPEIVVDGDCGRVIAPGDARLLAECITEILDNPEQRKLYAKNAVKRIREHFSFDETVQNYEKLYANL